MKKFYILYTLLAVVLFAACSNSDEFDSRDNGYITLDISAVSTAYEVGSRAVPAGYNPKQIAVQILKSNGTVVEETDDASKWTGKAISLRAGRYTVKAWSNGWDGNDSGRGIPYYAGSTDVTINAGEKTDAKVVCTLANVKVSVSFDRTIANAFTAAFVEVKSAMEGIGSQNFVMGNATTLAPAYFPVANLTATLTVVNKAGVQHTMDTPIDGVKARDHYILNYSVAETGNGNFTITADDSEKTYTYNLSVPLNATTTMTLQSVNAWSYHADVVGQIPAAAFTIDPANVKFQYKADDASAWETIDATLEGNNYKATIKELTKQTTYQCKMVYEGGTEKSVAVEGSENVYENNVVTFTTEGASQLPNANLDNWCQGKFNGNNCTYPSTLTDYNAGNMFWDTSNPGSSLARLMVTTEETRDVHTAGGSAAKLSSTWAMIKFAAASLYAGSFGELKGTNGAAINFGRPWADRPKQLKGWFKYSGGAINRNGGAPAGVTITTNVTPDLWSAYIVLADEGYSFDNTNIAGTAWNYATDPRVIAYGALADDKCVGASEWTEFCVDLDYHDTTRKPKTIMIVFSSSKYGDYFTGCDKSVLLLDDLELVYE